MPAPQCVGVARAKGGHGGHGGESMSCCLLCLLFNATLRACVVSVVSVFVSGLCHLMLHRVVLVMLFCVASCRVVSCRVVSYCRVVSCRVMSRCVVLCRAVSCHVVSVERICCLFC